MTDSGTQENTMKLGGGTANGMRALGYQVLPPEPNSDSTCWRMIAPQYPNTEYLAADQAEGWRKAERHWHARNLENVFRRAPHTPAADGCTCFGDTGMQASTFCRSDDVRCCDLCGKPVTGTPPTPATEEPWEGPLTDKENAMLEAAWQKHKAAGPAPVSGDLRVRLARAICAADFERGDGSPEDVAWQRAVEYDETFNYFSYADAVLPIIAAEIAAAVAKERAGIAAFYRANGAGSWDTFEAFARAIERNEHGSKP